MKIMKNSGFITLLLLFVIIGCQQRVETQGTVNVGGVDLNYVIEGSGQPILVIGSATYYPKAYSKQLRNQFELLFIDGRHFVPSYNPPQEELEKLTLETFADDIEAVRSKLGIDQVAILGHSVHAQIAIRYAEKYPEHTSHLILVGGVPYAFKQFAQQTQNFWDEHASQERKEIFNRNQQQIDSSLAIAPSTRSFAVSYRLNGPRYWKDPSYDAEELLAGLENGPAFSQLLATIPDSSQVNQTLNRLDMPILLMLGKYDFAIPFEVWESLIADLEHIDYKLLEESSHNPMTEHPEAFDKELISWLSTY